VPLVLGVPVADVDDDARVVVVLVPSVELGDGAEASHSPKADWQTAGAQ
jgi:hypothetical protein